MTKRLSTIEEVISELGGPKAVAELTGRASQSAVPMWKSRGRFPATTFKTMQAALLERGADAPSELWSMS
ncbi:carph-isopro domain-containing protein [Bradyrhizobium elkanii]|uniref:carph-isopro domain-containing protein n=1 Tax=Bradyrhizobium elkanii TaxID=29448 RepID=UPI0035176306